MCKRHAKMCNKWALAANNRNKGHPGTTTAKQKNGDQRMKGPVKWQRNTCWLAKKWVIISDQIARTEGEMAVFVLKKSCWTKGTLWGTWPPGTWLWPWSSPILVFVWLERRVSLRKRRGWILFTFLLMITIGLCNRSRSLLKYWSDDSYAPARSKAKII